MAKNAQRPSRAGGARVLLVNPNRMRPPVLPLGLELVADGLERHGHRVRVLDLAFEKSPLPAIDRTLNVSRPQVVGISVRNIDDSYYASQAFLLPPVRRLVKRIKERTRAPVVIGGVGFSIAPGAALAYLGADYGIRGDGEDSFPRLVDQLIHGVEPAVPGLVSPGSPEPEPARADFSGSRPGRAFFNAPRYFAVGGQGNIETIRGCDRGCVYCGDPVAKGRQVRRREGDAVAEEMLRLVESGVHAFHFCDAEFNLSRRHVEDVCRAIIKAKLAGRIRWYAYALPAPMDHELAALMARAGCAGIDFSVDAANDEMLERLGRPFQVQALETCAKACKKAGIVFMYDLLLGAMGETRKTMRETIREIRRVGPHRVGVSFGVRVAAGTPFAAQVLAQGPLEQNPCLHGAVKNNRTLLRPVFFLSDKMGDDPESFLAKEINGDPRFLFASRKDMLGNYNYNNNRPLERAIRAGERGAFWDILRRQSEKDIR